MTEVKKNVELRVSRDAAAEMEEERRLRLIVFRTIVQLSDTVTEEFLLQKLNYLDANSWMEIAEERYLGRLCGYPCCSNSVEIRKHQKYRIDCKNKKIFERSTERDKFCSEQCLMRFTGIRLQFEDEPLWLRGLLEPKKFDLNFSGNNKIAKPRLASFEYVEERIEKQLNNLVVGESNDTDDEADQNDEENVRSADDDEQFIDEISNFLSQKACISGSKLCCDKQITSRSFKESTPSNVEHSCAQRDVFMKSDLSDEEKLAKIRNKLASNRHSQRRGPPIVEAKSLDISRKTEVDNFDKEILTDLIKVYFGPKTSEFLRTYSDDWVEEMSECERILQQFYSGDKVYGNKVDDDIFMPKVDDLDQKSLRRDVFSRFIKPGFSKLECVLKTRGLYDKAQPLIDTLTLDASNVDLKKTDSQLLVALLFSLLAHSDGSLRKQFFPNDIPCDMFKKFVESIGCNFDVFHSVVTSYLHDL